MTDKHTDKQTHNGVYRNAQQLKMDNIKKSWGRQDFGKLWKGHSMTNWVHGCSKYIIQYSKYSQNC